MHTEIQPFESPQLIPLDFSLWGCMNNEVYTRQVNTRNKLLGRILDAVARMKKGEDQPRLKTRDLRTRRAKCIEV
jgi:flagellar biosynthesis/type III secretory pathway ATPase